MNKVIEATGTQVAQFNEFAASLAEYKSRYEGVVYDLAIPEQEKQAKTDRLAIGKVISKLDKTHKDVKAPLKERVDLLDGERKRIKDQLLALQTDIKDQIAEHEARIQAAKDELLRKASVFRDLREFEFSPTVEQVQKRIDTINSTVIDDSYGEMKGFAALNKEESLQVLVPMLAGLKAIAEQEAKAEQERLEAEAKARKEREEAIAKAAKEEAEQAAKVAAERVAKEAAAALAGAELKRRQALERENAAKAKAEEDARQAIRDQIAAVERAEAEAKRKAEEAEQTRLDAIEAEKAAQEKREANKRHCAKINKDAVYELRQYPIGLSEAQAKAVIVAIAKGKIPAVSISY